MRVSRLSHPGRILVALLGAALAVLAISPSAIAAQPAQARATHSHTWLVAVGEEADHDAIQGMAFLPGTLWINAGDKVDWTAKAGEIHTVTFLASGQPLVRTFIMSPDTSTTRSSQTSPQKGQETSGTWRGGVDGAGMVSGTL